MSVTASFTCGPGPAGPTACGPGRLDARRLDGDPAALRHGVARVDHQVDDHLLDLSAIHLDPSHVRALIEGELDRFADEPPEHVHHADDDLVEIQDGRGEHLLPAEGQELPRQQGGPLGRRADGIDGPARRMELPELHLAFAQGILDPLAIDVARDVLGGGPEAAQVHAVEGARPEGGGYAHDAVVHDEGVTNEGDELLRRGPQELPRAEIPLAHDSGRTMDGKCSWEASSLYARRDRAPA